MELSVTHSGETCVLLSKGSPRRRLLAAQATALRFLLGARALPSSFMSE